MKRTVQTLLGAVALLLTGSFGVAPALAQEMPTQMPGQMEMSAEQMQMMHQLQAMAPARGYLDAHKMVDQPLGLLGGPIQIGISQEAGQQIYRLGPLPVAVEQTSTPHAFGLESIAPNPASGPITITYHMARPGPATITVYDLLGRTVATLDQGVRSAGRHVVTWEPSNEGHAPAAGTYVARLQTEEGASAQLITLTRLRGL